MSTNRINVTRSSMPPFEEYCEEIKELWESRWLTNNGAKHRQLESDLKAFLGAENLVLYTNGHLALEQAIAVMDLPKGGEVITTPFTFVSTTHSIVRNGLIPVFCDVNETDYTMDVSKIEGLITPRTCAIVPVHVYGNFCDVEEIERIAKKHNLKVIYDSAHAFGATYKGIHSSNFGDVSMFSFHATKVYNTIEGGSLSFKDASLYDRLNKMKGFGLEGQEECVYVGTNAKMSEFQAAMGICNLRHLNEEIGKRRLAVEQYRKRLSDVDGIKLCPEQKDVESNYAYFPVVFDGYKLNRDEVYSALEENNIIARKYFYPLTNEFECYKNVYGNAEKDTPVAKRIAERVLTLPLYAELTPEDVDRICDIILK